ncbi:MAG: hypothetical protein M1836_005601 [Candelina mexicana]|nr:MAG: hypothetical protein M1836_005601 [Candelina mexicana]
MVRGKKGFERIVWAFKNVLNHSLNWLFCESNVTRMNTQEDSSPQLLSKFYPIQKLGSPCITQTVPIAVPSILFGDSEATSQEHHFNQDHAVELQEWLSLVALDSPRIRTDDSIDPYLSRYQIPIEPKAQNSRLVCVRWHGFITANWTMGLWVQCLRTVRNVANNGWFAIQLHAFSMEPLDAGRVSTLVRVGRGLESQPLAQDETLEQGNNHAPSRDNYVVYETVLYQT